MVGSTIPVISSPSKVKYACRETFIDSMPMMLCGLAQLTTIPVLAAEVAPFKVAVTEPTIIAGGKYWRLDGAVVKPTMSAFPPA